MFDSQKPTSGEKAGATGVALLLAGIASVVTLVVTALLFWFVFASLCGRCGNGELAGWGWVPGLGLGFLAGGATFYFVFVKIYNTL